jgi:tetratricopeptide (TPR) repeat protein
MNSDEKKVLEKLQRARDSYVNQEYGKAIEAYKWVEGQILDDPANLPIIQIELGWSYYNFNDFENCISCLGKAKNSPSITPKQRFDCLRLIGFSYQALEKTKNALDSLEEGLKQEIAETDKKYVYFEIGKIHFLKGAIKKSKRYLERASHLFDWKEEAYYQALMYYLGFVAYYEKQFNRAKKLFSEITEKATNVKGKASGYFGIAHLLYEYRDFRELNDVCMKIIELDKNFYDRETLAFFLSKSFMELRRYKEFKTFFKELRNNHPNGRYQSYYPVFEKKLMALKNDSEKQD